jgi:hypothetical protein
MSDEPKFHGHMTMADGTHVPLTEQQCKQMWEDSERHIAERAKKLPDVKTALAAMFEAYDRLRELGWQDACYCPKDGSSFEVIEPGSTGIFRGHYAGTWPSGTWWVEAENDLYPSRPILFRLYPEDEAKRKARMDEAREKYRRENQEPSHDAE